MGRQGRGKREERVEENEGDRVERKYKWDRGTSGHCKVRKMSRDLFMADQPFTRLNLPLVCPGIVFKASRIKRIRS